MKTIIFLSNAVFFGYAGILIYDKIEYWLFNWSNVSFLLIAFIVNLFAAYLIFRNNDKN